MCEGGQGFAFILFLCVEKGTPFASTQTSIRHLRRRRTWLADVQSWSGTKTWNRCCCLCCRVHATLPFVAVVVVCHALTWHLSASTDWRRNLWHCGTVVQVLNCLLYTLSLLSSTPRLALPHDVAAAAASSSKPKTATVARLWH